MVEGWNINILSKVAVVEGENINILSKVAVTGLEHQHIV